MTRPHPGSAARGMGAVLAVLLSATLASGAAPLAAERLGIGAANAPTPVASYTLRARLDPNTHAVGGDGSIRWVNTSEASADELYFHLYLNAFKHNQTVFNRSPFTRGRSGRVPRHWGHIDIRRLTARELGGVDLLPHLEHHSPGDPLDATDLRVKLPTPVAPGSVLTLDIAWESVLPEIVERTGFSRDFHFVGQWFPKLARLEKDGTWAHFTFHPYAEFYADFGDYDVTLDVPEAMRVGATGHRVEETVGDGRRVVQQRASGVHDFAWTAWPAFEERHARVLETDVHLLYPPGHGQNAARTLDTLRFALPHFNSRYGPYPYADLTVVHPPRHAAAAGGMEYPTLITTGGAWHASYWSRAVELVTLHELGHQWFHGLLATNEQRWPFLDEGLNSYAESVAAEALFGAASASDVLGVSLSSEALRRVGMQIEPHDAPLALPASGFVSFAELAGLVYSRTALLFETVANVYGEAELDAGLARYAERHRFGHPGPEDLLLVLTEALGEPAVKDIRAALYQGGGVNYVARNLRSVRVAEPRGLLPAAENGVAPVAAGGHFESRIEVHRQGELQFPVDILLITASGEHIWKYWNADERVEMVSHIGASPVVCAVVDPKGTVVVEENLLDNAVQKTPSFPVNTLDRLVYWFQLLLGLLAP